jgi:hypothetical protein
MNQKANEIAGEYIEKADEYFALLIDMITLIRKVASAATVQIIQRRASLEFGTRNVRSIP